MWEFSKSSSPGPNQVFLSQLPSITHKELQIYTNFGQLDAELLYYTNEKPSSCFSFYKI